MSTKMQEIRANAERANELAKQLAAEGNLLPKAGVKTSLFTNMVPENIASEPVAAKEVASEPVKEIAVESDTQPSAKENQSETIEEERLISEKQYKSAVKAMNDAQRKAAEAEKLLREQSEQNQKFQAELQQIKSQLESETNKTEEDTSYLDSILQPYAEELPDTTEVVRRATKAVKDEIDRNFRQKLMTVEQQIQQQKEEAEKIKFLERIRLRDEQVKKVHSDYDEIRMSDEFKSWIYGDAPSIYRAVYEGTIDFDEKDAEKVISDYKLFAKPSQNSNSRPKVGSAEVGIKTPSSVVPEMGISNEPDFTAEDMEKLPYMIHRVKDPAQRKALMEKADRYLQSISK
jgi:hypothetical protein